MTSADSFFLPSEAMAKAVDAKVRGRLRGSLPWLAESFPALAIDAAVAEGWQARPAEFGFYFDLASAKYHGGETAQSEVYGGIAERLAARITEGGQAGEPGERPAGIAMTTLSPDFYDAAETDCLVRWFDLEPENRMALLPLEPAELAKASDDLNQAVALIRQTVPELAGELDALTREFVFAKPGPDAKFNFGGASSFALWGAMALNGTAHPNWWEYIVRVVHEFSHNLLFGIAADEALVLNAPEERYPSPLRGTLRPIDGIYHACYVSARETLTMDRILGALPEDLAGSDRERLSELFRQRRQMSVEAYFDCRSVLDEHARPTALGRKVLDDTAAYMDARVA